jgi:hypothetical protein
MPTDLDAAREAMLDVVDQAVRTLIEQPALDLRAPLVVRLQRLLPEFMAPAGSPAALPIAPAAPGPSAGLALDDRLALATCLTRLRGLQAQRQTQQTHAVIEQVAATLARVIGQPEGTP